jgi:hypothetical protein
MEITTCAMHWGDPGSLRKVAIKFWREKKDPEYPRAVSRFILYVKVPHLRPEFVWTRYLQNLQCTEPIE